MTTILIATTNAGKRREVLSVLSGLPLEFCSLEDFPDIPAPEEIGATFEENALLKANYYAKATNLPCLADDSGLEVDALGGAPGVHSARFAGAKATDRENNSMLLSHLVSLPLERRVARYCCVIVFATPDRIVATAAGAVEGLMTDSPLGSGGFGYDPHFLLPKLGLTMAELSLEQKNQISHRGQALRSIRAKLERWCGGAEGVG
ncbi:MAG: XTP/dITP diphosphatase [Planctomycetota bacterium]